MALGNLQVRTPSHVIRPVNIRWPSVSGGLCNISITGGGISYLTRAELRDALKNMASGALTYSFLLALQVMVPAVEGMMTKMNYLRQFANKWALDSCQAGENLTKAAAFRNNAVRERVCGSILTTGVDLVGRYQDCQKEATLRARQNTAEKDDSLQGVIKGSNYNVAWIAIKEHSYLKNEDTELKQFYMSLTGTIVVKDGARSNDKPIVDVRASLLQPNLLETLLRGGTSEIYSCGKDTTKCLTLTQAEMTIAKNDSMIGKARGLLTKFVKNIKKDIPLESEEQTKLIAFVNSTRLPILRMLYINLINTKGAMAIHIHKYTEVVAYDILYDYLMGILNDLLDGAEKAHKAQLDQHIYAEFIKRLDKVKSEVLAQRQDLYRRHQVTSGLIEEVRLQEQQAAASIDIGGF
ncbi:MAG: conjugal transfer protein TraH [Legionellales bacterium]|nr:conjugal transfer protein TraH [Legionellales bacterium]